MVTMTTASVTPAKTRLDQPTMKFTAVKVDVSRLTSHSKSKAFVISGKTTSRDLADMVMRKLKVDDRKQKTCLLADKPGGGKVLLEPDDRVLRFYGAHSRRAPTFELIPAEAMDPIMLLTSLAPSSSSSRDDGDVIKAGNLSKPTRNGMTLPGYKKLDANSNVTGVGEGFLTSTPDPEQDSATSATADSGFIIHYEPFNGGDDVIRPTRSRSFELARDGGCADDRMDLSGNASDSGLVVNGLGATTARAWTGEENGLEGYPYRPSPRDGFQILQSAHSAWTPFDRHASDGLLRGITDRAALLGNSVPDVSGQGEPVRGRGRAAAAAVGRRSLPRMSVSQEELDEKKRSVTDLFAVKLRLLVDRARRPDVGRGVEPEHDDPLLSTVLRQAARDDDDGVSVTSQEVAEILSSASPLKPYEDDELAESGGSPPARSPPGAGRGSTSPPSRVFVPLADDASPLSADDSDADVAAAADARRQCSEAKPERRPPAAAASQPPRPKERTGGPGAGRPGRGVPLYALLATHLLAPVRLRRNLRTYSHFFGVRLCDVTYAKCVRHVLRHWEASNRQFSVEPKFAESMLVAVGGIDRRSTVVVTGKLFRGDIIVEVNGRPTLEMSARDVIELMNRSEQVLLVVARSRLNVERAQSP